MNYHKQHDKGGFTNILRFFLCFSSSILLYFFFFLDFDLEGGGGGGTRVSVTETEPSSLGVSSLITVVPSGSTSFVIDFRATVECVVVTGVADLITWLGCIFVVDEVDFWDED